jgi:hypothetical protein
MWGERLSWEEVLERIAESRFLGELIGRHAVKKLKKEFPNVDRFSASDVLETLPDFEDLVYRIKSDRFVSFQILSDDEGGSESGPWYVTVYGACGVWLVESIEYDSVWFADRRSAVSFAHDRAHESIIEMSDFGISRFQKTNEEFAMEKLARSKIPRLVAPGSRAEQRVLGFYLDVKKGRVWRHSKYGDHVSDLLGLMMVAFDADHRMIREALSSANDLEWSDASRALILVQDIKAKMANLERDVLRLEANRRLEIEGDDWLRSHQISNPVFEDFVRMAADLKPFFHYREGSMSWDAKMPAAYHEAYKELLKVRSEIAALRSLPEEE